MIKAAFEQNRDTGVLKLCVKGHAGAGAYGQDIICSAASVLAYTLARCVRDADYENKLIKPPTIHMGKGNTSVVCKPKEGYTHELLHAFLVIQDGFSLLAENYPAYVKCSMFGKA